MEVYHMSRTLRMGDAMVPDFERCFEHTAPFIQALERSEDCFCAMVFQGKYMYSVFRRSRMSMEWVNYAKWATEAAFEFVRRREFPDCVSRLCCNYFFAGVEEMKTMFRYDWGGDAEGARQVHLYRLELEEEHPRYFDMRIYDQAYDAMEKTQDLDEVFRNARRYFAGECTADPVMELLSEKTAVIVEDMEQLHQELME